MITIRVSEQEEILIKNFASAQGKSVSNFLRDLAMEKIEDEYDLNIYEDYLKNENWKESKPIDELIKGLGLEHILK